MYCDRCGRTTASGDHERCAAARALEPPRYCAECGRRLVVQVLPVGWTATCSEHGLTRSPASPTGEQTEPRTS